LLDVVDGNKLKTNKCMKNYRHRIAILKFLPLAMRITIILFLFGVMQTYAVGSYAQMTRLTINEKEIELGTLFKKIEKDTDFYFFYNDDQIEKNTKVNVNVQNKTITEILDLVLKNTNIAYRVNNKAIILNVRDNLTIQQQKKQITGTVVDESGIPAIGVSIVEKGTTNGVMTDENGKFSIRIGESATLTISYLGYIPQEIKIGDQTDLHITLKEDLQLLEEIIVVGYGVQKRVSITGAISSIAGDKLKESPVANVSNALGGKVSGIITRQDSGEPGNDAAQILLRGTKPLVLVDGVERDWDKTNMQDIESITVLKDASAVAPYGLKGANGVVLITTKRGKSGKPMFSYSGRFGWQNPANTPEFMNSADGLRLRNKALLMDNNPSAVISDDIIREYEKGSDAYPNTDWIKNYLKSSTTQNHNISVSGGTDALRAYISLGYFNQGSMFGDGNGYDRYSVRSNLDFKVTKITEISLDMSLVKDKKKSHLDDAFNIMTNLYRLSPREPDVYSNGLPAFQESIGWSMNQLVHSGGESTRENDFQNLGMTVKQELPFLKGLSAKGYFNYDKQTYDDKSWRTPMISYKYDQATNEYTEDDGWLRSKPSLAQTHKTWSFYTVQGFLNYENQFGKHGVTALAVYERRWGGHKEMSAGRTEYDINIPELNMGSANKANHSNSGTSSKIAQDGWIFRANYNYDQKYLFEFAGRYDRSYRYAPGRRNVFFPSASLGWRISEEKFIKDRFSAIDNLKLRASYGKSGDPAGGEFAYLSRFNVNNSYVWGLDPKQVQGLSEGAEPNIALTWETVWKANIGFDLNMWKGLFGMEFDLYRDYRKDKIMSPVGKVSLEYGIPLSDENSGKDERYGVDVTFTNQTKITSDLSISNHATFSFTRNRMIEINEVPGTYNIPRFRRTGYADGLIRGYKSAGLFKDQEDIDNWAFQNPNILPGDIKYVDINGDGKIDSEDRVIIGKSRMPEIMYGYNLFVKYKDFDLNLFLQGTGNSSFYMGNAERGVRYPFDDDKPLEAHAKSWTTDNPDPNAPYPRLSYAKRAHNYEVSDYWVKNTAYLRLKTIELGYNLNAKFARKFHMDNVRLYLNLYNVWTIHSNMPKDFDPENQVYTSYPQQFITTFGVNITF